MDAYAQIDGCLAVHWGFHMLDAFHDSNCEIGNIVAVIIIWKWYT